MTLRGFWANISMVSAVILAAMSGTASATVYGLKSAADCCDSTAPTYLFKFGETGGGVSGVREVKVGTARVDADGLAVSPSLGLYAFQLVGSSSRLLKINESTGAAAPVGPFLSNPNRLIRGALFDQDDRLLALDASQNQLIEIDPQTGALIGSPIPLTRNGAGFDVGTTSDIAQRADGTFFLIQSRSVFTLDIHTGALTLLFTDTNASGGSPYISISGAAFSANAASPNHLFVYDINGSDDIFRFDVTVGSSSRRLVYSNVVSSFNAGRGDLAAVVFPAAGNNPPTADAGPDKETPVGTPVSLDGTNSSDPDGDVPLSYAWTIVSAPEGSSAVLTGADTATPSLTPDVRGIYTIELVVTDSKGLQSSPDEVLVSTTNTAPVADAGEDQEVTLGTVVTLDGTGSSDPDGDALTYRWSIFTAPEGSMAELSDPTAPMPTFEPDVCGEYVITLVVTDTVGAESPEDSVTISVVCANQPPIANTDAYSVAEDTVLTVAAPGVLGNDTDADGDALTAILVSGPSSGALDLRPDGSFTYTPASNFNGADQFTYQASDGELTSDTATVALTVSAGTDPPVAQDDAYSATEDTPLTVPAPGVLANDTDADGDTLMAVLVSEPAHGTLILNADGSFTYTPDPDFSGTDSFTYRASDGALTSNAATVTLTVAEGANADLAVTLTDAPDPVRRGRDLTYTATARNDGPDEAQDVALTLKLTGSAILVRIQGVNPDTDCTITCSGGSSFCTLSSLTCAMGDLASGAQRALTVTVQPTTAGTLSAMASVEADAPDDPDAMDNTKTATTTVTK